jgi:hypothetical protein
MALDADYNRKRRWKHGLSDEDFILSLIIIEDEKSYTAIQNANRIFGNVCWDLQCFVIKAIDLTSIQNAKDFMVY